MAINEASSHERENSTNGGGRPRSANTYVIGAFLLVFVALAAGYYTYNTVTKLEPGDERSYSSLKESLYVEEIKMTGDFMILYVRNLGTSDAKVTHLIIKDKEGNVLGVIDIPDKKVQSRKLARIVISPLLYEPYLGNTTNSIKIYLGGSTPGGSVGVLLSDIGSATSTSSSSNIKALIGLLIERNWNSKHSGPSDLFNKKWIHYDYNETHWFYLNLINGRYEFSFYNDTHFINLSGYANVVTQGNPVIDLVSKTFEERYAMGPAVVVINPTYATGYNNVTIIPTYYHNASNLTQKIHNTDKSFRLKIVMKPLVNDEQEVLMDSLVLIEDLWTPELPSRDDMELFEKYDNLIDHVLRFTYFTNSTVRIELVAASGGYLHMLLYDPVALPDIGELHLLINDTYEDTTFHHITTTDARYSEIANVIKYIKRHGGHYLNNDNTLGTVYFERYDITADTEFNEGDLYDPYNASNLTSADLPVVFYEG